MRRKFATWLVGKNVQMARVTEGLEDARVIDLSVLADALDRKGEASEALALSLEAVPLIPMLRPLIASKPPSKRKKYAHDVGNALKRHAVRLDAAGWVDAAMDARREAIAIHVEVLDSSERLMLGGDCWERAEEELAAGRAEDAIAAAELALQVWSRIREEERDGVLGFGCSLNLLSRGHAAAGHWRDALAPAEEAGALFPEDGGGPRLDEGLRLPAAGPAAGGSRKA